MRAFFTQRQKQVADINNLDAIDIITDKYRITIRISGISVLDLKKNENVIDEHLDFADKQEKRK